MFTGIIETVGTLLHVEDAAVRRLTLRSSLSASEIALGASVAVDGCCLTVVQAVAHDLSFEVATEALARTTLGTLQPGHQVNLERALRFEDRFNGHMVTGHVDEVGVVRVLEHRGGALYVGIEASDDALRLIAPRGSVCLAGVSLTVTDVRDSEGLFFVSLVPYTLAHTTLQHCTVGVGLNVEVDILARYLERLSGSLKGQVDGSQGLS